ncbi:Hypothetical predicted protein [Octopus vulgaris]|uniref:Uncharacterized protein n=1 Tax=Octopus vulgaris TaxID=6645 RepID=A0AA36FAK8_OCTVU|nr:Hypothetical predicted protein [Octopus vulgaris]
MQRSSYMVWIQICAYDHCPHSDAIYKHEKRSVKGLNLELYSRNSLDKNPNYGYAKAQIRHEIVIEKVISIRKKYRFVALSPRQSLGDLRTERILINYNEHIAIYHGNPSDIMMTTFEF